MLSREEFIGRLLTEFDDDAPTAIASLLLRTNSRQGRALIAHGATGGALDFDDLLALALDATDTASSKAAALRAASFDPKWLLQAARLAALQGGDVADPSLATALFELVRAAHGLSAFDRRSACLYAQLLVTLGRRERLSETMPSLEIPERYRWSIELDSVNPFTGADNSVVPWLEKLNELFISDGLVVHPAGSLVHASRTLPV